MSCLAGVSGRAAASLVSRPPYPAASPHRALGIGAIYSGHDHDNDYLGVMQGVRQVRPLAVA